MKFLTLRQDRRQRGMALILAIGFLAVLSILGALVMRVSTQDMQSSGLIVPKQKAFYSADRAVEYALNRDMIYYLNPMGDPPTPTADLSDSAHLSKILAGESNVSLEYGLVEDMGETGLPPYLASIHGSDFGANLYHVKVKTISYKNNPTLEATSHVDAAIVRLYKKDDDQIFRTSGGG